MNTPDCTVLEKIYGESKISSGRFHVLADQLAKKYQHDSAEFFTAPGRTEIIGNHTDHNGGKVIAGSITLDTIGAAAKNNTNVIHITSEGYDREILIDLSQLSSVPKNQGTESLVAGMMEAIQKFGFKTAGFDACVSTTVIRAAGVSSSASFEMLICSIVNYLFNDNAMTYVDFAKIGQYAENVYWEKSSGLMDQLACAVGGTILLDFSDAKNPKYEKVDFSFHDIGYELVIVNTGKGHADLSQEYSEIPSEMKEAAKAAGASLLCETKLEALLSHIGDIENDRAVLRALHFFTETKRVEDAAKAMEERNAESLLKLIQASGTSSWEWLQNCYTNQNPQEQKITLALALTQLFLDKNGRGICRVHGGGFAGVIACILPKTDADSYVSYISKYFGEENVYPMNVRPVGAIHIS
ncbi:MAG: galactokinase [Acetivibrio ethanolgignens]